MQESLTPGTRRLPTAQEAGDTNLGSAPSRSALVPPVLDRLFAGEGRHGLSFWDADLALLLAGRRDHRG
jgi:hypothetical protein